MVETQTNAPKATGQAPAESGGEFVEGKGSLDDIDSWNLSPTELVEIRVTEKADNEKAKGFLQINKV